MEKLLTPRFGILEKKERSLFIFEYFFSPRNVITCYIKIMIIPHNVIYLLNKNISIRFEYSYTQIIFMELLIISLPSLVYHSDYLSTKGEPLTPGILLSYTMSEYLSQYKSELIERYIKNQISNSENDTLHALLQHNRSAHTATERDIFAQLTLWVLLHAPAREIATTRENVNVKTTCSLPLKTSENAQKSVKNTSAVVFARLKGMLMPPKPKQPKGLNYLRAFNYI